MAGLSVNEMTTYRWSFEEDIKQYAAAGIEAIGVWRRKVADYGEDKAVELIVASGLKVSNVLWAGGFTGSDGHTYREGVADAMEALQLTRALGSAHLVIYTGARNGHTQNHARRLFTSALDELLPAAEELGVVMAVEPVHAGCAEECTFLTSLDEAVKLVATVDSPSLKLAFDTYHLGHDPTIVERIPAIAQHIGIVHLGDSAATPNREQNRCCLGEGILPLPKIIGALRQSGYDGYYDVELIGEAIESCDYQQLLERSKAAYRRWVEAPTSSALVAE